MNWFWALFFGFCCLSMLSTAGIIAAESWPQRRWAGWFYFVWVQTVMGFFTVLGWVLLIPFCLTHAWRLVVKEGSFGEAPRPIDAWVPHPLNWVYGNPEDGVSGQYALVWNSAGTKQVPYMLGAPDWWRAYCWSALRNSCDNLKYVFAWEYGPQAQWGRWKIGWWEENGKKVPLL